MNKICIIFVIVILVACDPASTISFHIENETNYQTTMSIYSSGEMIDSYNIEANTIQSIWHDKSMDPDALPLHEYDSIGFDFKNGNKIMYRKSDISDEKNIFGDYWIDEYPSKNHHKFVFILNDDDLTN